MNRQRVGNEWVADKAYAAFRQEVTERLLMHQEAEQRALPGWGQDAEELSTVVSVITARFAASTTLSSQGAGVAAS